MKRTREAQEKLFQEKERLDVTIHSIGEGVIVTDTNGTIMLANPIAEDKCALAGPITGLKIFEVLPILDPLTEEPVRSFWVANDQGGISEHKGILVNLSGRRDLSYNSAPVKDRAGYVMGYVIVFRDITDDVRLQKAYSEAQRLDSIGQLAGGIAHSFNNVLTSILGNIEMLSYAQARGRPQKDLPGRRQAGGHEGQGPVEPAADLRPGRRTGTPVRFGAGPAQGHRHQIFGRVQDRGPASHPRTSGTS